MSHGDAGEPDALGEQLSALWSGDLPAAEADALRRRIAAEPEVAAQWNRLRRTLEALEALPDEQAPPPLGAVGADRAPGRSSVRRAFRAAPWVLLAASVALWLRPAPVPEIVPGSGPQWVEGEVRVAAGDVSIDVDGRAWIAVEPAAALAREGGAEDEMNRSTVLAALAGAGITVAVIEGSAVVRASDDGDAAPVRVAAGETHRVGPGTAAAPKGAGAAPTAAERLAEVARLERELAEAKEALAASEFAGALARGQLEAMQGTPSPWPADVPPALAPEAFRSGLEASLAGVPDVEVTAVDCDEYPCVATLRYTGAPGGDDDWNDRIGEAVRAWLEPQFPDRMSLSLNSSRFRDGDREERYVIFGVHPGERDDEVGRRTEFRMGAVVDELGQRMRDGE